jgi:hypothetical protein
MSKHNLFMLDVVKARQNEMIRDAENYRLSRNIKRNRQTPKLAKKLQILLTSLS